MAHNPFTPTFDALPETLPILPLPGVILLPRSKLPLNIFEPRYLAMTFDALRTERMIGVIQPRDAEDSLFEPALYGTGCAGRITGFRETDDGRLLIALTGVIRFDVVEELPVLGGYRRVVADWQRFASDLAEQDSCAIETPALLASMDAYFQRHDINVDREALKQSPGWRLVNELAMGLPFAPEEKQALVEAMTVEQRAQLLAGMARMAASTQDLHGNTRH